MDKNKKEITPEEARRRVRDWMAASPEIIRTAKRVKAARKNSEKKGNGDKK